MNNDIINFFRTRRTYRKFRQEPLPDEIINEITEAARLSSCGGNRQNLKYVVIKSLENVRKLNSLVKWAGYLPKEVGTPCTSEIPVMFIAVLQDTSVSPVSDIDAGLAIGNMTACAWAHGVGSCIMGAIDRPAIKEMLNLPEHYVLSTVVAFGYPSKKSYVVDMKDDSIKYYLDENGDTCVPKRSREEIIRFFD